MNYQIGDYLKYVDCDGEDRVVKVIGNPGYLLIVDDKLNESPYHLKYNWAKPILLTLEVLKKIGYDTRSYTINCLADVWIRYNRKTKLVNVVCKNKNIIGEDQCLKRIEYLHELQQVVRLLSNKEMPLDL